LSLTQLVQRFYPAPYCGELLATAEDWAKEGVFQRSRKDIDVLDIVIVNHNSTDDLILCLQSIYESLGDISIKVFIQDNASDDNVDRLRSRFPQAIVSKNRENIGFARAINKGLTQSTAPYVVLINPDTVVRKGCFEEILTYMEKITDIGVVGPKILNTDGTTQGSARAFPTPFTGLFGRNTVLTKWFPNNPITRANMFTSRSHGKGPMDVDWVSGACMVVKRRAIEEVGLLDTRFFLYWEDADWCRRMWQKGWKVVYHPIPTVVHSVGTSSSTKPIRSLIEFHKSCYKLFDKYNRTPFKFINPLVAAALALRLMMTILLNKVGTAFGRVRSGKNVRE
jgi:GT2 family glycosyltransferase